MHISICLLVDADVKDQRVGNCVTYLGRGAGEEGWDVKAGGIVM